MAVTPEVNRGVDAVGHVLRVVGLGETGRGGPQGQGRHRNPGPSQDALGQFSAGGVLTGLDRGRHPPQHDSTGQDAGLNHKLASRDTVGLCFRHVESLLHE